MTDKKNIPDAQAAIKLWNKGLVRCNACNKTMQLQNLQPLQLIPCSNCQAMFFVPKKVGAYFLYEPSGGGGMGSVYKAVSEKFPAEILAIKILSRAARENPADIHALLNEARVSSFFVNCDFIAACLDSGYEDGEYFAAMPYINGERLDKRIDRLHQLPEKEVMTMGLHLLAAEQHIFHMGYLYRDLKPENIIINEYGYAVLLDFGLCIPRREAENCEEEFISGSPYYLPPERLLGQGENACSEIYSLGMLMYHALTGRTFFDADEIQALARRHISGLRLNSAAKMQGLRNSIAILLDAMLRQEPNERPQDFEYVADSLKAIIQEIG
ncbi:MAG: serine/threonine protein kinase [Oligosphaeraceae bacterium]|nr:serine/threonine protein kinase [Oligosphaeraceae bacterium]